MIRHPPMTSSQIAGARPDSDYHHCDMAASKAHGDVTDSATVQQQPPSLDGDTSATESHRSRDGRMVAGASDGDGGDARCRVGVRDGTS